MHWGEKVFPQPNLVVCAHSVFFLCSSHFTHCIPVTSTSPSVVAAFPADRHCHLKRSSNVSKIAVSVQWLTLTALLSPMLLCTLRYRAAEGKWTCLQYSWTGCPPPSGVFWSSLCIFFWTLISHSVFYSRYHQVHCRSTSFLSKSMNLT